MLGLTPCVWISFLVASQTDSLLFLMMHACHMTPVQPNCFNYSLEGATWVLSLQERKVCVGEQSYISSWYNPTGHGRPMPTTETDLALFLLYVSHAVPFNVILHCLFLDNSKTRCNGERYLESSPGIDNWSMVLCLKKIKCRKIKQFFYGDIVTCWWNWVMFNFSSLSLLLLFTLVPQISPSVQILP